MIDCDGEAEIKIAMRAIDLGMDRDELRRMLELYAELYPAHEAMIENMARREEITAKQYIILRLIYELDEERCDVDTIAKTLGYYDRFKGE